MSEKGKHLEPIGEDELALEKAKRAKVVTPYNHFVESVVTREIAKKVDVDPGKVAHIFKRDSAEGIEINIVGSEEVVKPIGDVLELGGYKVREWHIKRADDPAKEAEKVHPALAEMLRNMPATIGSPEEILKEVKGLPLVETPALTEAGIKVEVDKLAEEGSPFQKLGEDLNKQIEGGSEDGETN